MSRLQLGGVQIFILSFFLGVRTSIFAVRTFILHECGLCALGRRTPGGGRASERASWQAGGRAGGWREQVAGVLAHENCLILFVQLRCKGFVDVFALSNTFLTLGSQESFN